MNVNNPIEETRDESLFDVEVLEEIPDDYVTETAAVAGAGCNCSNAQQL